MQRGLCFSLEQTGSGASGLHGALRSAVEQTAEHHHKGEHDKIPETAHAMADETGNDHKDRAADGKDRQDIVLPDGDRKSTRLNSSHRSLSRMPSSA